MQPGIRRELKEKNVGCPKPALPQVKKNLLAGTKTLCRFPRIILPSNCHLILFSSRRPRSCSSGSLGAVFSSSVLFLRRSRLGNHKQVRNNYTKWRPSCTSPAYRSKASNFSSYPTNPVGLLYLQFLSRRCYSRSLPPEPR